MTVANASQMLNAAQIGQFREDGFLVVRGFFNAAEMRDVSSWSDDVVKFPEVPGRHMVYYEDSLLSPDKRVLSRVENFCPYHPALDDLLRSGRSVGCVSQLLGEQAILFKDKINFKMPGGDGFKAHQDVQAGWSDFANLHITLLLSIDAATPNNGCLEVARGQHRSGLLGAMWEPLAEEMKGVEYEVLPTEPGDALFFDSFIPHRSQPNFSDAARRILYITYNAASGGDHRSRYYAEKRANYPPDCERDPNKQYRFKV